MNIAIIVAGGTGSRLSKDLPKQFLKVGQQTIIEHTIEKFLLDNVSKILISIHRDFLNLIQNIVKKHSWETIVDIVIGGRTRQNSVFNGLDFIKNNYNAENVLIHDAARPLISQESIKKLLNNLKTNKAVSLAVPSTDTIIKLNSTKTHIEEIPQRDLYWQIQTPQCFNFNVIYKAHNLALKDNIDNATDDTGLVLKYNLAKIAILEGDRTNIKITYPKDLDFFERRVLEKN